MIRRAMFAVALVVGGLVSPLQAIEMFTNFNNGTELGNRPYGIDVMSPVRYHAYPQGRWFRGCENSGFTQTVPAAPSKTGAAEQPTLNPQSRDSRPLEVRPQIVVPASNRAAPTFEDQWIRSSNFLPPALSN